MRKRPVFLMFLALFLFSTALYAEKTAQVSADAKEKRDAFYLLIQQEFHFTKSDCDIAKKSGYSPYYCFKLLCIAHEAKKPLTELISMVRNGDSWMDMCQDFNIDYGALMDSANKVIIENNILFPVPTPSEAKKDVSTGVRKRGGK